MGRGDPRRYRRHKGMKISGLRFQVSDLTRNKKQGTRNINNVTYLKKDIRIGFRFLAQSSGFDSGTLNFKT
jgi:hypothetical protein